MVCNCGEYYEEVYGSLRVYDGEAGWRTGAVLLISPTCPPFYRDLKKIRTKDWEDGKGPGRK